MLRRWPIPDGRAFDRLDRARRDACDAGDHPGGGGTRGRGRGGRGPRSTADLILATIAHLKALEHVARDAEIDGDGGAALDRWHAAALTAHAALDARLDEDEVSPVRAAPRSIQ